MYKANLKFPIHNSLYQFLSSSHSRRKCANDYKRSRSGTEKERERTTYSRNGSLDGIKSRRSPPSYILDPINVPAENAMLEIRLEDALINYSQEKLTSL